MRISSPTGKFTFTVLYICSSLLFGISASALMGASAGLLVMAAIFLTAVIVGARTFRGPGEEMAAPRPFWKMTAGPAWGWVLAALLLAQGIGTLASVDRMGYPAAVAGAVSLLLAAAFVHSSVRLARG